MSERLEWSVNILANEHAAWSNVREQSLQGEYLMLGQMTAIINHDVHLAFDREEVSPEGRIALVADDDLYAILGEAGTCGIDVNAQSARQLTWRGNGLSMLVMQWPSTGAGATMQ